MSVVLKKVQSASLVMVVLAMVGCGSSQPKQVAMPQTLPPTVAASNPAVKPIPVTWDLSAKITSACYVAVGCGYIQDRSVTVDRCVRETVELTSKLDGRCTAEFHAVTETITTSGSSCDTNQLRVGLTPRVSSFLECQFPGWLESLAVSGGAGRGSRR